MKNNEIAIKTRKNLSIEAYNPMQEDAFEAIQKEENILLLAPTGSGKTLAFLLPVLMQLKPQQAGIQCLILTPSRELALQIEAVWKKMATGFKVNTCYGGHSMSLEMQNLSEPPALLIGTPGRIFDHLTRRSISLKNIKTLVLDEFDKSLSMGFQTEMAFIIERLKHLTKRVLVSATSSITIPEFTGIKDAKVLDYTLSKAEEAAAENAENALLTVKRVISVEKDKVNRLFELLCHIGSEPTIIFCNQRDTVERTTEILNERGIEAACFHGGMEQADREKVLLRFRNGSIVFLVASDLAARGLDIPEVKHVVHLQLCSKKEEFTHRNGRTARQNAEGTAYIMLQEGEPLPKYVSPSPEILSFPKNSSVPPPSEWVTLYISGGKKDKISKMDIAGFFLKKGSIKKEDLGLIAILDFMSFVAVKKNKAKNLLTLSQNEKMKGAKFKITYA
jgi:superfamily II DNA/RNA helicase